MSRRPPIAVILLVIAAVMVFIVIPLIGWVANLYTDVLWYQELGQPQGQGRGRGAPAQWRHALVAPPRAPRCRPHH